MTTFGKTLRSFRHASNDPDRLDKRLTQERLGELIGHEMDDLGFSGAAVSDWERGESKINAQDRRVLITLIQVLNICGGLQTLDEANHFLETGNYRALDASEVQKIFVGILDDASEETKSKSSIPLLVQNLFAVFKEELQIIVKDAKEGPTPSWPRLLAALIQKMTDRFSFSVTTIIWIGVWLGALWLTGPSLRWPFADYDSALHAIYMYVGGTLAAPLLIGLLINTKDNEYWKQQNAVNPFILRLYTYQGAGIGFNLGYFFVFPLGLARYYLHLESTVWIEISAVTLALILGNMAAHVVPHNLWRAYGRLTFKDGGVFFIVALLGPLWGFFFMEYYSILLAPVLGTLVILLAMTGVVIITTRQAKNKP